VVRGIKNIYLAALFALAAARLVGQTWDIRLEAPFPKGQSLQQTMLSGTGQLISGDLDTGNGAILSVSHRLLRVGPVLRLEWGAELTSWETDGHIDIKDFDTLSTKLKQAGLGIGVNAQLWVPFIGISGEMGAIQRFQRYKHSSQSIEGAGVEWTTSKTWLRVGARWRLPFMRVIHPYIAASYQQPITKEQPIHIESLSDLADYFNAQGKGQEFNRMWTFGVGIAF
jgi:hypothetical protein